MEILVYVELNKNEIPDYSYDLISYAKEISNGNRVLGVLLQPDGFFLDEDKKKNLRKYGLDKLYLINTNRVYFDKRVEPFLIVDLIKKIDVDIFILTSTSNGREIAPVVASCLNTGLTADCTKLEIEDSKLISTRPTFGGKLMASIMYKKRPEMATVRKNSFKKKEFNFDNNLEIEFLEFNLGDCRLNSLEIIDYHEGLKEDFINYQNAKVVLAGGMGLKNKENFEKLKLLAKKTGAIVGATRKAVDRGLIERKYQIGQTGSSTSPLLYVGFGISGAIHHIVGMENSKKIIAINTDKNAPVFKSADIGLVEDAIFVLDKMLDSNISFNI